MPVPVDANARVRETFVTTIKRNVVINLAFVVFRVLFCPSSLLRQP